ncbi:hypothetical protein [Actinoplanes philippinensis]|nr:hypothetical protein [Actinoplanes philippinensis]
MSAPVFTAPAFTAPAFTAPVFTAPTWAGVGFLLASVAAAVRAGSCLV